MIYNILLYIPVYIIVCKLCKIMFYKTDYNIFNQLLFLNNLS